MGFWPKRGVSLSWNIASKWDLAPEFACCWCFFSEAFSKRYTKRPLLLARPVFGHCFMEVFFPRGVLGSVFALFYLGAEAGARGVQLG